MSVSIINAIFGRIDIPEGIDFNKTSASKECNICPHWYFFIYSFKSQQNVWNRCHALLMMPTYFGDIAILNIKSSGYWCIISLVSKNDVTKLFENADLTEKSGTW